MKKWIVLAILIAIVTGAGVAYFQWNKSEVNVMKADATKIASVDLYSSYTKDSVGSKAKYFDKILQVSGAINSISKNQLNQTVIQIKTSIDGAFVNCTFDKANENPNVKTGDTVELKGICKGIGEGDKDLGIMGDVYLVRCYLIQ
jgi:hypothetical protein